MKRVGQVILFLLILCLLLGAAYAVFHPNFVQQLSAWLSDSSQQKQKESEDPNKAHSITEFASCAKYGPAGFLWIPEERFAGFSSLASIKMTYTLGGECLKLGEFSLAIDETLAEGATSLFLPRDEKVIVEEIVEKPINQIDFSEIAIGYTGSISPEAAKQSLLDQGFKLSDHLYVVKVKKTPNFHLARNKYVHHFLADIQFGKYIGNNEKDDLYKSHGALVIDIRSPQAFNRKHSEDAINIPYLISPERLDELTPYSNFFQKDTFRMERLPQDKNKPIVVIGESDVKSLPALRALTTLYVLGWKNLYLLRGGETQLEGKWDITPRNTPGITTLDAAQALAAHQNHIRFFGILDAEFVAQFGKIQNPILDYQDISEIPDSLTMKELKDRGDFFLLEKLGTDKNVPIVFYGKDDYDWRPLKAAIWARDAGFTQVAYFRGGIEEWRGALLGIQAKVEENAKQQ